jgi:hypothetical protein
MKLLLDEMSTSGFPAQLSWLRSQSAGMDGEAAVRFKGQVAATPDRCVWFVRPSVPGLVSSKLKASIGSHPEEAHGNRLVSYTYAATGFFVRLALETGVAATTVSVQAPRYESSAVIAGIPSCFPIARQDNPSSARSLKTSSLRKTRFGLPTIFPAA